MTGTNLLQLFSVNIQHGYFPGAVCTCLQFVPDSDTLQLQQRFGFTMRTRKNGFSWYASTTQPLKSYLEYVVATSGAAGFVFSVHTRQPEFFGFTEMPVNQSGQMLISTANAAAPGEQIPLTVQFGIKVTGPGLGVLEILFSDLLRVLNNTLAPVFTLSFDARKTQWQYYVINESAITLSNPAITGTGNIVFDGPKPVTLPNGQQAMLFTSGTQLLPLSEQPAYIFSLVNKPAEEVPGNRFSVKTILKGLPTPIPEQFELLTINGSTQLSSPMYVYI